MAEFPEKPDLIEKTHITVDGYKIVFFRNITKNEHWVESDILASDNINPELRTSIEAMEEFTKNQFAENIDVTSAAYHKSLQRTFLAFARKYAPDKTEIKVETEEK